MSVAALLQENPMQLSHMFDCFTYSRSVFPKMRCRARSDVAALINTQDPQGGPPISSPCGISFKTHRIMLHNPDLQTGHPFTSSMRPLHLQNVTFVTVRNEVKAGPQPRRAAGRQELYLPSTKPPTQALGADLGDSHKHRHTLYYII